MFVNCTIIVQLASCLATFLHFRVQSYNMMSAVCECFAFFFHLKTKENAVA